MTTPAVLALTEPSKVPAAAIARLQQVSGETGLSGYAELVAVLAQVAVLAAGLLELARRQQATRADGLALDNAQRLFKGAEQLFSALAPTLRSRERVHSMALAKRYRHAYADILLPRREYLQLQRYTLTTASTHSAIRLNERAQAALSVLDQDWLLHIRDVPALAREIERGVRL